MKKLLLSLIALLSTAGAASAAVTVRNYYQLGENDPGAVAGNPANATTVDLIGGNSLTTVNAPVFRCDVAPAATTATGSLLAMSFNGANQYCQGPALLGVTDNFWLEAWVKAAAPNAISAIAYNGNSGSNGWGLFQYGTTFVGIFGGISFVGSSPVTVGAWTHLAIVRDAGVTTLYVNGAPSGTTTAAPVAPDTGFAIAATPGVPNGEFFNGEIDQARFSTFAAGAFVTSDLLFYAGPVTLPPVIATSSFSGFQGGSAILNATVVPAGADTLVSVRYGLTTGYGSYTATNDIGSGVCPESITWSLAGLAAGQTYHYQIVAVSANGTIFGNDQTFTGPMITALDYYQLGENDAGAVAGSPANAFTVDLAGVNDLTSSPNAPLYSCDVAQAAALTTDSTLSMSFNGVNQYLSGPLPTTTRTNFALEAWVKANTNANPINVLAFNGDPGANGWGFVLDGNQWRGLLGGITYWGGAAAATNVWTHLAVVNDQGTNTLYVNGVSAGVTTAGSAVPTGNFWVGSYPAGETYFTNFNGLVDQVRLSTFQSGQFSTNQLLLNSPPVSLPPPVILSSSVNDIELFTASFNATVNPNRANALVYVTYGLTPGYGAYTPTNSLAGSCVSSLVYPIAGLAPGTTYHYQTVVETTWATNTTADATFTTPPAIPVITAEPASGVTSNQVTLNAGVFPDGSPTTVYFQYGPTTNYGGASPTDTLTSGFFTTQAVAISLTGLPPGTFFHYQLVASNASVVVTGPDQTFHTAGATLPVNSLADDGGASTLRSVIAGTVPGDSIVLAANGVITLTNGEIWITNNLTITGPGATNLALSGNHQSRVFDIATNVTVTISDLTITNGLGAPSQGYADADGGGIYNAGTLTLSNCVITANQAGPGTAGSPGSNGETGGNGGAGGGIYNAASLLLVNSQVSGNSGGLGGAGGAGANGRGSSGEGRQAGPGGTGGPGGNGGAGGGIYNAASLSLLNCGLDGNSSGLGGLGGGGGGGGAGGDGGIDGAGGGGGAGGDGGAGGGIYNAASASLTLANCGLDGNSSGLGGAGGGGGGNGIFGGAGGNGGNGGAGGGIYNAASLTLANCGLNGDSSGSGGAGGAAGPKGPSGGGGNGTNGTGGTGGAIENTGGLTVIACTLADNSVASGGAGGGIDGSGTLLNTIVARNFVTNTALESDLSGSFVSEGYNLIGVTDGSTGLTNGVNNDLCGTAAAPLNPLLGPLTNNGGFTLTCALLPGSPAIGTGDPALPNPPYNLTTDQIGQPRFAGAVDIGSFQVPTPPPVAATLAATGLTLTSATLNGTVIPNGFATTVYFIWGPGAASRNTNIAGSLPAGTAAVSVSNSLTGLAPGTTYYYMTVASNVVGVVTGAVESFTTAAAIPPVVSTLAVSGVSGTSATLNGTVWPNGLATAASFAWGTTTNYGQTTAVTNLGNGSSYVTASSPLTGLAPGTTYHFQVFATNNAGGANSADYSFTTPLLPQAVTHSATGVSSTAGMLNATVNPNGLATTVYFIWGPGNAGGNTNLAANLAAGTAAVSVSDGLTGLAPHTAYSFQVIAVSAAGTNFGAQLSLTTPGSPEVTGVSASAVTGNSAVLNGSVTARGAACGAWFAWGTTTSYGQTTAVANIGNGWPYLPVSQAITGLNPGATYHYRLFATNSVGVTNSADYSFTTPAVPSVVTHSATAVTSTSATLNGTVNPNRAATTVYFIWGPVGAVGNMNLAASLPAGTASVGVSNALTGLAPHTAYAFQVMAVNAVGTNFGALLTLTTPGTPEVADVFVSDVTTNSVVLNGLVTARGAACGAWFAWGTSTNYGQTTAVTNIGAGWPYVAVNNALTGLIPGTTYHFQMLATNSAGATNSADMVFTLPPGAPVAVTHSATGVSSTVATLNGTVNPVGLATAVYFVWGPGSATGNTNLAVNLPAGMAAVGVSNLLTDLSPHTAYYFQVMAVNALGTNFGAVFAFTTPDAPEVKSIAAIEVTSTSAVLSGLAIARGTSAGAWFVWGATTNYGQISAVTNIGAGWSYVGVSNLMTGLNPGTKYHFRMFATNIYGSTNSADYTFTTPASIGLAGRNDDKPSAGRIQILGVKTLADGSKRIYLAATPCQTYVIEAADNPAATAWSDIKTNTADANGEFSFIDPQSGNAPARYYRARIE